MTSGGTKEGLSPNFVAWIGDYRWSAGADTPDRSNDKARGSFIR